MSLIELRDITKTYHLGEVDLPVLKGISLSVDERELTALMGASGSGKSTLMNILGCLDHPTSGEYRLDGREVGGLSVAERARIRNRMIGFVFQNFNLLPRMSALDNVLMPLSYSRDLDAARDGRERAVEMLEQLGLRGRLSHHPSKLSGGEQQRVAIARALINRPRILLADEPTGNLDSRTSEEILEMFTTLNTARGITILLVTHDLNVAGHARRVIHIKDGRIESGTGTAAAPPVIAPAAAGPAAAGGAP